MILIYFLYGLAFFSLGMVVFLEARRASKLPLGRQLPWLAAFALLHCLVEWADMFLLIEPGNPYLEPLITIRLVLLPLSAVLLVRFGIGLIQEAGPLPYRWLAWAPVLLIIPAGVLLGYVLTVFHTEPPVEVAAEVWSRYLIYFPGNLLASFGFIRQWHGLKQERLRSARNLLLGAAIAFFVNAFVAGLVIPTVSYGLGPWINYEWVLNTTRVPVQVWRMLSAVAVTLFVVKALGVFEEERNLRVSELEEAHIQAQQAMVNALSAARVTAEDWIDVLVKISSRIAEMEDTDQILQTIVQSAQRLLKTDTAVLALWDEDGNHLDVKFHASQIGLLFKKGKYNIDPIILDAMRYTQARCYPEDYSAQSKPLFCPVIQQELKTAVLMPLKLEKQVFGGIWVGRVSSDPFSPTDKIGLERLAGQAVISVTHAHMAARLQSLAVIEERTRIGREMHDSIAQVLGYLRLETQTMEALVNMGDDDAVMTKLRDFRQNIDTAHADVRENILSLRTTLSSEGGTIPAMNEYLMEFGLNTGIQVTFKNNLSNELNLSPLAETQMVRIVQEALTNVRKHAQAKKVLLQLDSHADYLNVTITDDGVGFKQKADRGQFGLQTMRERAESVSGGLTIDTKPGVGTQIRLWLPFIQRHRVN